LQRAREACENKAWRDAYEAFLLADASRPLAHDDLDRMASATYLVGREMEFLVLTERSHRAHAAANRLERAARDAFWLAFVNLTRGEIGQTNAWIARGQGLIGELDCAERGYLSCLNVEILLRGGNVQQAKSLTVGNISLAQRHGDADLLAAVRHQLGRASIQLGQVSDGVKLLDETMLAVVGGELSPLMTGFIYCSVIDVCRRAHQWSRASEWTAALSRWCERQGGLVAFTDTCLVHRAEILRMQGAWQHAMEETCRICDRGEQAARRPPGAAYYEQGEIHRLRGESARAEQAYRAAHRCGFEPQPGLALLRLAEGRTDAACASIRRLMLAASNRDVRGRLLPAFFEIMLAVDDIEAARGACEDLEALRAVYGTESVCAQAAHARGALFARCGDTQSALAFLRESFDHWERLAARFEAARVRTLIAEACEALGDDEAAALERDAARAVFEQLGARGELERLDARDAASATGVLTARELDVLRFIAQGLTNKAIAKRLELSERTIDRHVSNILDKLDAPSRAAAIATAAARKLL
jgi:DNA-binding CsgD family transcriptional regulator